MARIQPVTDGDASAEARNLLDGVQRKLGTIPNLYRALAHSPEVLGGYLQFLATLDRGQLSRQVRELIALTVGQSNDCQYCLSAHATLGRTVGLSDEQIDDARREVIAP